MLCAGGTWHRQVKRRLVYRSMSLSGACNIAVGIVILVVGIVAGVMAIISGAGLLKTKKNIMF